MNSTGKHIFGAPPLQSLYSMPGRLVVACCCLLWVAAALAAGSIQLGYQEIMGFPVKYVTVNMNDPEVVVTPAVCNRFPTGLENWEAFLSRVQPDAAINGTYFCLHTFMPVGDVAVDGALIYRGVVGTALCIDSQNQVTMRPGPRQTPNPDWHGARTVLCAGPRLLTDGQPTIYPRDEGFRDAHVMGSATRSAVAWRPDNTLILLTIDQDISLMNLACVCRHLGATNAMALDGGSCSALYAEGRTVTRPGRGLSTILAVYASREKYRQHAEQIASSRLPVLAQLLSPRAPVLPATIAVARRPVPQEMIPIPAPTTPAAMAVSGMAAPLSLAERKAMSAQPEQEVSESWVPG